MVLNINMKNQIAFLFETVLNLLRGDPNLRIYYLVVFLKDF